MLLIFALVAMEAKRPIQLVCRTKLTKESIRYNKAFKIMHKEEIVLVKLILRVTSSTSGSDDKVSKLLSSQH